jgi:hypothetical protein
MSGAAIQSTLDTTKGVSIFYIVLAPSDIRELMYFIYFGLFFFYL